MEHQDQQKPKHLRSSSFSSDETNFTDILCHMNASRWADKLNRISPPRWKSQQELYEAANWKPGIRMTPMTPTPSPTPSPRPSPYSHVTYERSEPTIFKTSSRAQNRARPSTAKPATYAKQSRVVKRVQKHKMITRSRCKRYCCRVVMRGCGP